MGDAAVPHLAYFWQSITTWYALCPPRNILYVATLSYMLYSTAASIAEPFWDQNVHVFWSGDSVDL